MVDLQDYKDGNIHCIGDIHVQYDKGDNTWSIYAASYVWHSVTEDILKNILSKQGE
jgi:hypothetical protein